MNRHRIVPIARRSNLAAARASLCHVYSSLAAPLIFASLALSIPARAADIDEILLNEATVRGPERVELYNKSTGTIDLSGWKIGGSLGTFIISGGTIIGAGQYLVIGVSGFIFHEIGGEICLLDLSNTLGDRVWYGNQGSAPLCHDNPSASMARAPDASSNPPQDPGPASSGLFWTLDFSSTFGVMNDARVPAPGSTVILNEISPRLVPLPSPALGGPTDVVELYNPTGVAIDVTGWIVSVGTGIEDVLAGVVPPGGFLAFPLAPATFADDAEVAYLFDDLTTRVDQVGWTLGPDVAEGLCYARCGDGAGPNLGYEFLTTGGGVTWFLQSCTLGLSNGGACDPVGVMPSTWGAIKSRFGE